MIILLLMVAVLLVLGTFMDLAPLIVIATPIFLPLAKAYGVDPVHFGVVLILAAGIGLVTPPVGSVLFVGASIGEIPVMQVVKALWPFYLAAGAVLLLVVIFPQLSLFLPHYMA
jgi:TRAP-type C4-dicarboxylate transport system permease large subunit